MKHRRRFTVEFKRQVMEELLGGFSSPAQIIHGRDISSGLLYRWKEQYARGKKEPSGIQAGGQGDVFRTFDRPSRRT
jgi:transposase-like protein